MLLFCFGQACAGARRLSPVAGYAGFTSLYFQGTDFDMVTGLMNTGRGVN
jgi:hypothetical protein